ncbi:MAG: hypothetical protein HY673_17280 [Chloroflexi bacterium]|nr:hypothetical protein [Chloroflexota bacterium]
MNKSSVTKLECFPLLAKMTLGLEQQLQDLEKNIKFVHSPDLASSVHWTPSETFPVHRWFRYREGFSPYLLDYFSDSRCRLDPFCGCGTTLLESAKQGVQSYGIDLNPLATFVAQVKTRSYSGTEKTQFGRLARESLNTYQKLPASPKPPYALLDKLFQPDSLETLLKLNTFISSVEHPRVRDLMLLAWLDIIERSSNVFKEGNGLKYRNKRRRPGKYLTIPDYEWIPRYFGDSVTGFIERLWATKCKQILDDIEGFRLPDGCTPYIRTGSCLEPQNLDFGVQFDLAIFSPPYANRFDYFEAFKMEMWMGRFVTAPDQMAALRSKSMRNNLAAKKFGPGNKWQTLLPFLDAMDCDASSVRMGIKNALQGYFADTRTLLANLKPFLKHGAKVVIVMGNSAYARSIIPSDVLVARIGIEEGYNVDQVKIARKLHVSSQQRASLRNLSNYMRESVVVLECN